MQSRRIIKQLLLLICLTGAIQIKANNSIHINAQADFVSDYIWRGAYQNSGFSVQPTLGVSYKGFGLAAWGSQSITNSENAPQEFDINLSYTTSGVTLLITDYWWEGMYSPYGYYSDKHHFEGTLSFDLGQLAPRFPLLISWSTMFAGADPVGVKKHAYSTYIAALFNIECPAGISVIPSIGVTPWKGMYDAEHGAVTDIALKASKNLKITEQFDIPLFIQAIVSPAFDKCYLIAGLSVGF